MDQNETSSDLDRFRAERQRVRELADAAGVNTDDMGIILRALKLGAFLDEHGRAGRARDR